MKIALLSPLPPEATGIAAYADHFAAALREAGVQVLTPTVGQTLPTTPAQARRWVAERHWSGIDVVHAELGAGRLGEFLLMQALSGRTDRPALSATVHDPERMVWRPVGGAGHWFQSAPMLPRLVRQAGVVATDLLTLRAERELARRLDGLVVLTRTGANALTGRMRVPASRVRVIGHGVREVPVVPLPPLQPLRLIYFGYIYRGKGLEDLVDALAQLQRRVPEVAQGVRLTIAGGTAPDITFGGQSDYLTGLRERVRRAGLDALIDWQLDVDEADVSALIQDHHVMVLPYRESLKLSVLGQIRGTSGALAWATACHRGVITSDARSFAEEISHGNGASYRQGDVAALAQRLHELLMRPELAGQWAAHAGRLAQARLWRETARRFGEYFEHACHVSGCRQGRLLPSSRFATNDSSL